MTKQELKKNLRKIQALERELMRELTEEEINILLEKGDEAFIYDYLQMEDEDLKVFQDIKDLVSTWCTKTEDVFDEMIANKDYSLAYFVLKSIVNSLEEADQHKVPEHEEPEHTDTVESVVKDLISAAGSSPWLKAIKSIFDTAETPDEACGEALDATKDTVIENIIKRLKAGEELELDSEIIDEVIDTLWNTEDNVNIFVKNNKIRIK